MQLLGSRRSRDGIEIFINIVHRRLNIRVETAVDLIATVENQRPCCRGADSLQPCQIANHIFNDGFFIIGVNLLNGVFLRGTGKIQRLCFRLLEFLISEVTLIIHLPQNGLLTALVILFVIEGVIIRRQIGNACNRCAFRQGQFRNILAEILLGGSLNTPAAFSEIGHVEVPLHDFLFIVSLFQLQGTEYFF